MSEPTPREKLYLDIAIVLNGISFTKDVDESGFWETQEDASFGEDCLAQIKKLIEDFVE
jgi:hypothetical protein